MGAVDKNHMKQGSQVSYLNYQKELKLITSTGWLGQNTLTSLLIFTQVSVYTVLLFHWALSRTFSESSTPMFYL